MALSDSSNLSPDLIEIDRTLEFLTKGKEKIQLDERYRNVTLVLGITGSAKSTFVQWLAGDNTKLISEFVPGTHDFVIKDDSRISNSTIKPMTIYPQLVVDPLTYNAYYDCLEFSDTRNASVDIVGTYYIKSVADYTENVRMIFTVGHDAVKVGNDRIAILTLLKHSTNLIRNVDKYRNSIALVVTKVVNSVYQDENGQFVFETDEEIINTIANFFNNVKNELKKDSSNANANYIKFIDALLQKDGPNYSKIAIFRKPNMSGHLSEIPLLRDNKLKLLKMLKQLRLTLTEENDFGYSISGDSRKTVLELANILNNRVWQGTETIARVVASSYQQISAKINSFLTTIVSVNANLAEARTFATKLKAADRIVSELSNLSNVTARVFAEKLNYILNALEIDTLRDNVEQIALDVKHLEFFQNVADTRLVTKPWESLLKVIINSLSSTMKTIQTEINSTAGRLNTTVQSTISGIASDLLKATLNQMQSTDIQALPVQLEQQVATMRNQTELRPKSIKQLATEISKNVASLGLETIQIQRNTLALLNSAKYLSYLQTISVQQLNIWSPEWISPLVPAVKSLYESLYWYRFLNDFYSKMCEYDFQQDISRFNVANIEDWGEGQNKPQDIQIDEQNFKEFLNKISHHNIWGHFAIKKFKVAHWQLNELNQVLNLTLKQDKAKIVCTDDGNLVVTGDFIKFSDLKQKLADVCPNNINSVNIYASNTVFIDRDLNGVGDRLKFALMAPRWVVVDQRRINLDGSHGEPPKQPKARNSNNTEINPEKGLPGFSGGSAGSFLGIVHQFVNRDGLTITADGGVGGAGQAGGDARNGTKGLNSMDLDKECNVQNTNYKVISTGSKTSFFRYINFTNYQILGSKGTSGGIGGDGGSGGNGGYKGKIQLFYLDKSLKQEIETNNGNAGSSGLGGLGGYDGQDGDEIDAWCMFTNRGELLRKNIIRYFNVNKAQNGLDGANNATILLPLPASKFEHPAAEINDYKKYLRNNLNDMNDRFKRNPTIALLDQLGETTQDLYDSLTLTGELEDLEEQSHILINKPNSIHYYQSLLNRITAYATSPKPEEKQVQHKKVFSLLSAAAQGKLYNLKAGEKINLSIDEESYLTYVQENMNILNQIQKEHNVHEIVQLYKNKYYNNIQQQINEFKDFIENQIKPEFDTIGEKIDKKIDQQMKNIKKLIKDEKENQETLKKMKEELQSQIELKTLFGVIGVARQVVSFVGQHSAAIGSVIGASSLPEEFVIDDQTSTMEDFKMPPGIENSIKSAESEYRALFSSNAKILKTQLELLKAETRDIPEMSDFGDELDSIVKRVPTNVDASNYESTVAQLKENLNKAMKKEADKKETSDKKRSNRAEEAFKRTNQVIHLGSVALELNSKHRGDKAKMDVLERALTDIKDKINAIEKYKENIFKKVAPDMYNLMRDFKEIKRNLDNKTLVALDVQQWKAQGMLKNLKVGIQQIFNGQHVEAEVMHCFEMLDEAMSIIIKIYDRIQNYQQQQQLADIIANVNSVTAINIKIDDRKLKRAVEKLEIVIRSNVILQRFDSTVVALKQLVFPYARYYIEQMILPSKLSLNDTYIGAMVSNANLALTRMRSKLVNNRMKIIQIDKYSHNASFNSNNPCIRAPFYVWPSDEHANTLAKLLSGKSVVFKADIRNSDPNMDAIRFCKIELNFKAKNATLQPEINEKLEKFIISANHMGNSYYRYDRKYYVINNNVQNIKYSFAKVKGSPLYRNKVYDDIAAGNLMLSPYAMWQITLSTKNETVTFDQLTKYRDQIDLELVGQGSYTESRAANSADLEMDQFYSEYIDDDDAIDVAAQHERLFYSIHAMKQEKCRQYIGMNKASNSIHRDKNNTISYISKLNQTVSNYFVGNSSAATTSTSNHIDSTRFEYTRQQNANTNSLNASSNSVDVHANLIMGQLLVKLIGGKNDTLMSEPYMSPNQTRAMQVERLAQRVVPALSSATRSNQLHNSNTQWHRDWNDTSRNLN